MAQRLQDPLDDDNLFLSSFNTLLHGIEEYTETVCIGSAQLACLWRETPTDDGGNQRFVSTGCDEGQRGYCAHIRV